MKSTKSWSDAIRTTLLLPVVPLHSIIPQTELNFKVGRASLQRIEELVVEHGGTEVTLNSSHFRTAAHLFYDRGGDAKAGLCFIERFED